MRGRPGDWTVVVRSNWRKVTAYVVSGKHPSCLRMARDEVEHIDRVMRHVPLDHVADLRPRKHWFMAVIVCPGDDLGGLADWARDKDADRVHFYLHRNTDAAALAPWRDAGHPLDRIEEERFTAYGRMHTKMGLDLSDQVYGDFAP